MDRKLDIRGGVEEELTACSDSSGAAGGRGGRRRGLRSCGPAVLRRLPAQRLRCGAAGHPFYARPSGSFHSSAHPRPAPGSGPDPQTRSPDRCLSFLPCKWAHRYRLSRFCVYVLTYNKHFSLSDPLHSAWQTLHPSASLQMIRFCSLTGRMGWWEGLPRGRRRIHTLIHCMVERR